MTVGETYFEIFGLPPSYEIDLAALEAAYERRTLESHPDLFATADEAQKARSQRISARVNDGYRVLHSDGKRSAYLLDLLREDRKLDAARLPEGFLQEMFMLQEELEDLGEAPDEVALAALKEQVEERMERVLSERKALFSLAEPEPTLEALQDLQANLNCENYLRRLVERLG